MKITIFIICFLLKFHIFFSSGLNGSLNIAMISDDSGYYLLGFLSLNMSIWKYLFSSPTSAQCQQILTFTSNASGQAKISDTSFFAITMDSSFYFHFFKFTFGNTSSDWSAVMSCPVGATWNLGNAGSVVVSSKVYTFFPIDASGSAPTYATAFSLATGAIVSSRYKTSSSWSSIEGIAAAGSYVAASIFNGFYQLAFWNTVTDQIIIKKFNGNALGGWSADHLGR